MKLLINLLSDIEKNQLISDQFIKDMSIIFYKLTCLTRRQKTCNQFTIIFNKVNPAIYT